MAAILPPLLDIASVILILVLVALGLVVVFGLMGVINMAHGEFFLIGAYGVFAFTAFGVPFALAAAAAASIAAIFGVAVEALLIRHFVQRTLDTILATWGLSIVLKQLVALVFGPASVGVALPLSGEVAVGPIAYPAYRLTVMVVTLVVIGVVIVFYRCTNFGLAVRASIENPQMASAFGINPRRVRRASFAVGAGTAGLAGAMVAPLVSIDPQMGLGYLVPAFLSVLIGGAATVVGVLSGGAIIGGAQSALSLAVSPVTAQIIVFALAVVLIRLRPGGLFGQRGS